MGSDVLSMKRHLMNPRKPAILQQLIPFTHQTGPYYPLGNSVYKTKDENIT